MATPNIARILIVGGGSAGWMTAALMAQLFKGLYRIDLVESDEIATIGVGEATIPAIKQFNKLLDFDEDEFMRLTQGSFKLGIQFVDWWRKGESYIHGFGVIGQNLEWLRCHHYWLKAREAGQAGDFADYSINTAAALANKFMRAAPNMPASPLGHIAHAYHFDATLYARFLRSYAEARGVIRTEGRVVEVERDGENGHIRAIRLADGQRLEADLFVDCTGLRALLIGDALQTPFDDWGQWLPCDRAIAMPCDRSADFTPYTRSTAREAGWQWRIPLQHRTGNGMVYSSRFTDDATAEAQLRANLDGAPRAEPLRIRYRTGKRRATWVGNCVAVGLSAGFLEPLESTSLYLIQSAVVRLIKLFPDRSFDPATIAEFNRQTDFEYERIRDFIILHYKATERDDTEFWRHCRDMPVPETLARKIDLFRANGRIVREDDELFAEESWIQVFLGQGVIPRAPDPLVDVKRPDEIAQFLGNIRAVIGKCLDHMPSHADYVAQTCAAPSI